MTEQLANKAASSLNGAMLIGDAALTVVSAAGFPATGNFRVIVESELMLVTGVAGAVFTVTRGIEGTAATAHPATAAVTCVVTAASLGRAIVEGAPNAWTPKDLVGLASWYDVSNATCVPQSPGLVTTLTDLGPRGANVTQATGAKQATWAAATGAGGKPGLTFDGARVYVSATVQGIAAGGPYSLISLHRATAGTIIMSGANAGVGGAGFDIAAGTGRGVAQYGGGDVAFGLAPNAFEVWTAAVTTNTGVSQSIVSAYVNGAFAWNQGFYLNTDAGGVTGIGGKDNATPSLVGTFCEAFFVVGRAISVEEVGNCIRYFRNKWLSTL